MGLIVFRLDVTLRFLATGETYRSLMYSTRIHESTISKIVPETCLALCRCLKDVYLKNPTTDDWLKVAADFQSKWNFPNCLGALDGRHIAFSPPTSAGSYYHNYKGTDSMVLLALVDANYKFIYVNIGVNGRISDGGVFSACGLYKRMQNKTLNLPPDRALPGRTNKVPYVFIADEAFPLSNHLMKPFPQRSLTYDNRIYNYRLSRARRMVECGFGILANRWRVLLQKIHLGPEKVELITLTCVLLHNFLVKENAMYTTEGTYDIDPSQLLPQISQQIGNRSGNSARSIREEFRDYFNSTSGSVPWQDTALQRNIS
ncbi:unnamed protein product [Acanthoscelides obtectus]|uniref:DDE Tnp4 domain-containing protein n=3 Tax=Acanthoscelides obtectus TaxID=200917 RepID=A0A9P0JUB0_ACAOB|nr:unnamed protein product [Acanthoscelides obtectus]CAK1641390.1 Protein ALP1-like [Acanthoscelides obtectus]